MPSLAFAFGERKPWRGTARGTPFRSGPFPIGGDETVVWIAITQAAFEAIAATLPFGGVSYENKVASFKAAERMREPSRADN